MTQRQPRVLLVGASLENLTSAVALAEQGERVTVLERRPGLPAADPRLPLLARRLRAIAADAIWFDQAVLALEAGPHGVVAVTADGMRHHAARVVGVVPRLA